MKQVQHRQMWKRGMFGCGVTSTTICGRVRRQQEDMNMADNDGGVTCKFCLRIMGNAPLYDRYKKAELTPQQLATL